MNRLLAFAASAAVAVAGLVTAGAAPAIAAPVSSCIASKGVLVVVDFRPFNGKITRGCAVSPANGMNALSAAGYTVVPVQTEPFVCRINGDPAQASCRFTPPASSYWAYWHADKGQRDWTYSKTGAASAHPGDGSVDAWVFGATNPPCFTPADARAGSAGSGSCVSNSKPKPSTKPSPTHAKSTSATQPAHHSSAPAKSNSAAASRGSTRPTKSASVRVSTPASSPASSTVRPASVAPSIVDATSPSAHSDSGSGSAIPLIVGIVLVLLIGGGAGWFAYRRRQTGGSG